MIIQEANDRSKDLVNTFLEALNSNKIETMLALVDPNMPRLKRVKLVEDVQAGKTIEFNLIEKYGKTKVSRYQVTIDFKLREVSVIMLDNVHKYCFNKYKVK